MGGFLQTLKSMGPMRLSAIGLVGVSLLVFFVFLISRVTSPSMDLLYRDLSPGDASAIVSQLDANGTPYRVISGGTEILVPGDQVNQARIAMAERGLPSGGSIGYEIFDKGDTFGATTFEQNISHLRALEGELQRTITEIDKVVAARVHLVLPKRELFSRTKQEPSASIALRLRGQKLERGQVMAVQHLVAAAVPDMTPDKVSIIDERGNLLARGLGEETSDQFLAQNIDEQRVRVEARLRETIEDLLTRTVGLGKVRAEVAVDMDFNRVTQEEEIFDPEGQVVRSAQAIEETASSSENEGIDPVTLQTNLPDPNLDAGSGGALRSDESRTEETTNFEISRTTTRTVKEVGEINRITASVLVDGLYDVNEDGESIYRERSAEELEKLAVLVRGAIGFSQFRNDQVEVVNMQFADVEEIFGDDGLETFFGFDRRDLFNLAELLALTIVGILVILLVIRPLLTRMFEALPSAEDMTEKRLLAEPSLTDAALTGPGMGGAAPVPTGGKRISASDEEELINISQVEGRVKASSVKKIGEIVDKHPEEALSIIRNWLYQEG